MPEKQFRQFTVTKENTDEDNTAIAAISTDGIDRDKEVLLPKGVDFENYNKNPVVLWAHNYSETPVGKSQWVKQGRKKIKAKWEWADTDKAKEIKQLWDGGFLNAVSVGFIANKGHEPTPEEIKKNPDWAEVRWVVDEWELLEFSIVPVPANPEALAGIKELKISEATQKELGIDDKTFWAKVDDDEDLTGVASNDEDVEIEVRDEKKEEPVIVTPNRILVPHRAVKRPRVLIRRINPKDVSSVAINMIKGKIYM
jgi:HK97 family phage prohead protease